MWRVTAKLLWAFEFEEIKDKPLDVNAFTSSNLMRPLPYQVTVKIRSERHHEVLRQEIKGSLEFLAQYE
ncbi:uncharacterized protein A1O9_12298 [Exophiala aquamarina CBS 119918]|uniref:Uncharacterized protein n=1 Tax=Exophiala aquamarina CBS 119918 TaxID=1182545 RepID=A0A072NXA5_9EURO|nr:uncharacterized protein A1O9_12298 [Exophiala aquamarina CBS 119918]KEF51663.1 hypothetical protein A1O9_12298 [Exophiala aquamarina CBS 119918]